VQKNVLNTVYTMAQKRHATVFIAHIFTTLQINYHDFCELKLGKHFKLFTIYLFVVYLFIIYDLRFIN